MSFCEHLHEAATVNHKHIKDAFIPLGIFTNMFSVKRKLKGWGGVDWIVGGSNVLTLKFLTFSLSECSRENMPKHDTFSYSED